MGLSPIIDGITDRYFKVKIGSNFDMCELKLAML